MSTVARKTLLALALTSRSFVKCARRALYADPCFYTTTGLRTYAVALPLLAAVENPGVGCHVRKLNSLDLWANALTSNSVDNSPKRLYEIRGQPEGWAWAFAMLKACPNLTEVALPVASTIQVTKLIKPLRDRASSLKAVTLRETSIDLVLSLLSSAQLSLQTLVLPILKASSSSTKRSKVPLLTHETCEELNITSALPLRTLLDDLLPSSPGLRSLELSLELSMPPRDIVELLSNVGEHLTTFKLSQTSQYWPRGLSTYGRNHHGFDVPLETFPLLPSVKHLTLDGSSTISVARLASLARVAPAVESLSFARSVWVCDAGAPSSLPEVTLDAILSSLSSLKRVDLGFVPLARGGRYRALEATAGRVGYDLEYIGCMALCYACGEYH